MRWPWWSRVGRACEVAVAPRPDDERLGVTQRTATVKTILSYLILGYTSIGPNSSHSQLLVQAT